MNLQSPSRCPYRLKKRADEMAETRRRITGAADDLAEPPAAEVMQCLPHLRSEGLVI